ncbi:MAG: non-canonical purine NTP pyrophosphatase, RdgB/HAM1 family [Gammaproteobacteria bacterium]|nr:non-canonical purine NTP pyrophosphatase, RdgB/HAM1 family [Gammaproteobacteria bacterium]|tara:strand:- start:649 stop:1236 length:588 start_codon:yes stop_codon:yes gene_type:complete
MRVVLASSNRGKLEELDRLLHPLGFDLVSQGDLDITPAPETAATFIENALEKARHASRESGLPAIGDDSGLVVPALGGAPGILSARYAGTHGDNLANNEKLLRDLNGESDRRAHFYCALVFLTHAADPAPLVATAAWHGAILNSPRGSGGFGYDPLFEVGNLQCSAAELPRAQKNRLSHRGQAVQALCNQLQTQR